MHVRTTRDLAAAIRGGRMRRSMTQEQLAAACGLSRRTIGDIEAARSTPRFGALLAICEALEFDITIGDEAPEHSTNATDPHVPIDLDELFGDDDAQG